MINSSGTVVPNFIIIGSPKPGEIRRDGIMQAVMANDLPPYFIVDGIPSKITKSRLNDFEDGEQDK